MNVLSAYWQQLTAELNAKDRLRWGVWCILLLLGFYVVLVLGDWRAVYSQQINQQVSKLTQLQELEPVEIWQERLSAIQVQLENTEQSFWKAGTDGLAQAALQGRLEQLANEAGLGKTKVKLSTPVQLEALPEIKRLRADIKASFSGDTAFKFLASLEKHKPLIRTERLVMTWGKRRSSLSLRVEAYIQMADAVKTTTIAPANMPKGGKV